VATGSILVLPVYAAPAPEAVPVTTSGDEIPMGSVEDPAPEADVQSGTTEPVRGVDDDEPTLTVSETATAFSLVGVTWTYDPKVTDTIVKVRAQDAAGRWGDWTDVLIEDAVQNADAASGAVLRGGTAPLWTGPSTGVEAELVTRSGAEPVDVTLDLVDPGTSAADGSLTTPEIQDTANAAAVMPPVYSRVQWGADDSIRTWGPEYAPAIKAATVHHTADSNNYTADQVPAIMRSIYRYHTVSRGWGDIGYHVIADKFGRLWEGRYGGLSSTVVGAHVGGFNTGNFGVSMLGNYDVVDTTKPMINAVSAVIGWKLSLYGVDPQGSTVFTSGGTAKYAAGTRVTMPTVMGHRDIGSTACPGRYGYAKMDEIRAQANVAGMASFVKALYQDMMGRGPDDAGLNGWVSSMSTHGKDRRTVSRGFSMSIEYRNLLITQAYQQVLGRGVDPAGRTTWMQALATGATRLDALRPALMASEEFYLRGGSSDTAFVNNIYQAALGRGAGPAEVTEWASVRRRLGPATVISAVWGSPEAAMIRVNQAYEYYLGRTAGGPERQYWLPVVATRGDEQLREELVISEEYWARSGHRFP
jgi:hypothetical protein